MSSDKKKPSRQSCVVKLEALKKRRTAAENVRDRINDIIDRRSMSSKTQEKLMRMWRRLATANDVVDKIADEMTTVQCLLDAAE